MNIAQQLTLLSQTWELEFTYSPSWRYVGRYLHFTPAIEELARSYVNQVLGLPPTEQTPPVSVKLAHCFFTSLIKAFAAQYITIHVRHGDFRDWCWEAELPEDCFAPLAVIARRVRSDIPLFRHSRELLLTSFAQQRSTR